LFQDREKVDDIVTKAKDSRGLRKYSRADINRLYQRPTQKGLLINFAYHWLLKEGITYYEVDAAKEKEAMYLDAETRYNRTVALVAVIVQNVYKDKDQKFRWTDMSVEERREVSFVVEHLITNILTVENCLPVECAVDSWAAGLMLSVSIRNEGEKKEKMLSRQHQVNLTLMYFFMNISSNNCI